MVKRGDVVHTPSGWGYVERVYHRDVGPWSCVADSVWLVVTVERPDGTDDEFVRHYPLAKCEPEVLGHGHA